MTFPKDKDAAAMDPPDEKLAEDYGVGDLHNDGALMRRIDWRILPIMFFTYFLQFVDKVSLNVSAPDIGLVVALLMMVVCQCDGSAGGPGDEWE